MYDYVIVGGGSAGCALAARLSEMPDAKVLLLEAGPRDLDPYIHMPVGFFKMTGGPLTWGYETAPLYQTPIRNGRRCSAAVGYLKPARRRPNLTVKTRAFITRIIVENGRAVGVEVSERGQLKRIEAASEIIVTAGAIGSPKLL